MKKFAWMTLMALVVCLSLLLVQVQDVKGDEQVELIRVENDALVVEIETGEGAKLTRLYGKLTDHEYLLRESPLFSYKLTGDLQIRGYKKIAEGDSTAMALVKAESKGNQAEIVLQDNDITYTATITLPEGEEKLLMQVNVTNGKDEEVLVHITLPKIEIVSVPGASVDRRAMIPNEIGGYGLYSNNAHYGHGANAVTGMPTAFNAMEVAAVFNEKSGKGIAFYPVDGDQARIQMRINGYFILGFWADQIPAKASMATPPLTIHLLKDGWTEAIDLYKADNQVNDDVAADIPAWLLEAGAVYSTRREGTGGSYQCLPGTTDLKTRLDSFYNLPKMLDEAKSYGTEVLLLIDFYQRADLTGAKIPEEWLVHARNPYWNKGDYIPREDLGGVEAFKAGVKAVQEQGGKVIVYVEPFIVFEFSELGREMGYQWAGRKTNGYQDDTYIMNYTMQPANKAWQDKVVEICCRLVGEYGVDGILLDSMGWQWNKLYFTNSEKIVYSMQEYNEGLIAINNRVREAIREIKPDAVVMSESGSGMSIGRNDGGFTADYCWSNQTGNDSIVISPTAYAYPTANLISSGLTLNSLHQVFASGNSLSLCDYWAEYTDYIRKLVELRREYKDALVYGEPSFYKADRKNVGAYGYKGEENELLVVVNANAPSSRQEIDLGEALASSEWTFLLGGEGDVTVNEKGELDIRVGNGAMAVLKKK